MDREERYEYRPKFRPAAIAIVAGCFLAYLAFDAASTNDDGWPLYRTAQFFQSLVVYVYWGTFIACLCAIGEVVRYSWTRIYPR